MYRAVKVRIYPTDEQESYLAQCFGNTRWLWNYMLNATTTAYKETGKGRIFGCNGQVVAWVEERI
ncbi:transposase, IS605 OrfB family protein [Scytonema sp. HK-05]|nr:transposase, IS605 OrfB family protein [Scytonema sp. HK-05]